MLKRIRKAQENNEGGFTLIELLVVMIIIGILAAIAIPAFLNQKKKANETSAKADVTTIGKEVAAYYVDGEKNLTIAGTGTWTMKEGTATTAYASGKLSGGNVASGSGTYVAGGASTFCVAVATADSTAVSWQYTQEGLSKGNCTP